MSRILKVIGSLFMVISLLYGFLSATLIVFVLFDLLKYFNSELINQLINLPNSFFALVMSFVLAVLVFLLSFRLFKSTTDFFKE
jgi:hypothetical protein